MTKRTWIGAIAVAIVMAFTAQPAAAAKEDVSASDTVGSALPFSLTDVGSFYRQLIQKIEPRLGFGPRQTADTPAPAEPSK